MAQQIKADSLIKLLKKSNLNVDKVRVFIQLADVYQKKSASRSLRYAEEARKLSEKLNYQKGIGEALFYMSIAEFNLSKYTIAQNHLTKAAILYKGIDYKKGLAKRGKTNR